jgi:outer membrane protein OmpA-like peptidoglycan-associated protein
MINKLTLLIILISMNCFSQEKTKSEIIISRDNLISLLQKFRNEKSKLEVSKSLATPTIQKTKDTVVTNDDSAVQKKIDSLTFEIGLLNKKFDAFINSSVKKDTIFQQRSASYYSDNSMTDTIYKKISSIDTLYMKPLAFAQKASSNTDEKIELLNKKYDLILENQKQLLQKEQTAVVVPMQAKSEKKSKPEESTKPVTKEDITIVKALEPKSTQSTALKTLQTTIPIATSSPKVIRDTIYVKEKNVATTEEVEATVYSELMASYSKVKKQVFFENNSTSLQSNDFVPLFEVIKIIEQHPTVDIYLEGFASQKGNPTYNEKISLQRTEAVKQFLISKGIHPKRILSYYHGVDNSAPNEGYARRVDLTFEIRK